MAEEKKLDDAKRPVVSVEELRDVFAGPAFHSNKMYVSNLSAGIRLSFCEQLGTQVPPVYRTAVVLSYPDAINLRDLLSRQLVEIEKQIKHAEATALKLGSGSDTDGD